MHLIAPRGTVAARLRLSIAWRAAATITASAALMPLAAASWAQATAAQPAPPKIDTGDTAWMLASSALVLLMTPGLAFFYGGMVRAKNVLNMLLQSFIAMSVVTVLWVIVGYS